MLFWMLHENAAPHLKRAEGNPMQTKILWIVLVITNIAWLVAFQIVDKGRVREISERQNVEQQRDACQGQIGKLTDAMSKLCACGGK